MLLDEGSMTELEYKVYESLFLDKSYDWMNPSKMVYVKTSTPKCTERILSRLNTTTMIGKRFREGEQLINHDYLDQCTTQHEQYFFPMVGIEPITVDGNIEDEDSRKQIVIDLYNTLLGKDNTNIPTQHIEHSFSSRSIKMPISPVPSTTEPSTTSVEDTLPLDETLLTGIAQINNHNGRAIQAINTATGAGMTSITAFVNNPEILSWLNDQVDHYEITLRPIPDTESDTRVPRDLHMLQEGTLVEKPRIIALEGNIGAGKTTLLHVLKTHCDLDERNNVVFINEPVDLWNKFQLDGNALLNLYYSDLSTYGFLFQVMAYTTLSRTIRETVANAPPNSIFVGERSLISAQYLYTRLLRKHKHITDTQRKILYKLFREEGVKDISATDIIYLHTKPEDCLGKISRRDNNNNEVITMEYLTEHNMILQELYDNSITENSLLLETHLSEDERTPTIDHIEKIKRFLTTRKRKMPTYIRQYSTHPEVISIEGNIASGKSTLLKSISAWKNETERFNDIHILWDATKENDHLETESGTLESAVQGDPIRYTFMYLVSMVTTFRNHIKCTIRDYPDIKYIVCENSIFTIRWAFRDLLHRKGHLSTLEAQVLEELCDDPTLEWLNPTRIIFLNTSPEICKDRIQQRIDRGNSSSNTYPESYKYLTLSDVTQYKESLKNIHNLGDTMEINGDCLNQETLASWVTQISHLLPQL
jgi:deoxyadenosine/deoxycytidine kinase